MAFVWSKIRLSNIKIHGAKSPEKPEIAVRAGMLEAVERLPY